MKIFSGSSNKLLAEKIAKELKLDLFPLGIHIFPDNEKRVRVVDKVVDEDTVVVQSASPKPDENYMELFFIIDALKRSGAKSVTAVIPYLGYQRQDHVFRDGEAVSLEVIIKTLEAVGMDKLITLDLHSVKIPKLFSVPVAHLSALPIFARKVKELFPRLFNDAILVSPDMGGIRRIQILSELLNIPYVSIVKDRDLTTGDIKSTEIESKFSDWKKGIKKAIIVDDMISTGRTIVAAIELLTRNGIRENFVFATHPVFSNDFKNILQDSSAQKIFVTDTIEVEKEKMFDKLGVLTISKVIADELRILVTSN